MPVNPILPSFAQLRDATKKFVANTRLPGEAPTPFYDDPNDNDPDAIPPVMEGRGQFIPYRGTETHGVALGEMTDSGPQGYGDGSVAVMYDAEPPKDHVVSVRIVTDAKEEIKAFRTDRTYASSVVTAIVNRNRQRTSVKIKNIGGGVVLIGHDTTLNAMNGYPLADGAETSFTSTEAIYAVSQDGTTRELAILTDFTQDI